jgi:excisionase family DNA binding protein
MPSPAATRPVHGDGGFDSAAATGRILLPELPVAYRPKSAAKAVDVSRPLIAGEIKAGRLAAVRLGGVVLVSRASLQSWLDNHSRRWEPK